MIKKILWALIILMTIGITACSNEEETSVNHDLKHQGTDKVYRIIPLSTSLVDILCELDIEMVGVPDSQYGLPDQVKDIERVGLSMNPDVEKLAQLEPTHILSLITIKSLVQPELEQAGLTAEYYNLENIDELKKTITQIGKAFDKEKEAGELVAEFEQDIQATLDSIEGKASPKVLILFGFPGNYMESTEASFVGQMVALLGGENVVKQKDVPYVDVNLEELLVSNPDIILRTAHGLGDEVRAQFAEEFKTNPIWSKFEAVQNGRVYDLDDAQFNVSATLDTPEALEELANILYE